MVLRHFLRNATSDIIPAAATIKFHLILSCRKKIWNPFNDTTCNPLNCSLEISFFWGTLWKAFFKIPVCKEFSSFSYAYCLLTYFFRRGCLDDMTTYCQYWFKLVERSNEELWLIATKILARCMLEVKLNNCCWQADVCCIGADRSFNLMWFMSFLELPDWRLFIIIIIIIIIRFVKRQNVKRLPWR